MKKMKENKGFTLVELIVVIVITRNFGSNPRTSIALVILTEQRDSRLY